MRGHQRDANGTSRQINKTVAGFFDRDRAVVELEAARLIGQQLGTVAPQSFIRGHQPLVHGHQPAVRGPEPDVRRREASSGSLATDRRRDDGKQCGLWTPPSLGVFHAPPS